jgi:hypothetical protein
LVAAAPAPAAAALAELTERLEAVAEQLTCSHSELAQRLEHLEQRRAGVDGGRSRPASGT